MKRMICILLVCTIFTTGFLSAPIGNNAIRSSSKNEESELLNRVDIEEKGMGFVNLDDPELLQYMEEAIYTLLVDDLGSDSYFVENVHAIYISKEYLEEVAYNSQSNIYFGYTLAELESQFQGEKYIFTLGDDGKTTVQKFEAYDDTYERIVKNVVIGSGVILICVTISAVAVSIGAPAVSLIFAASAQTGTTLALSSGLFSGVSAGVMTGINTKDFRKALKAAALAGSEGFKWGAISGIITGGLAKTAGLYGAKLNGLTMNEAAKIQLDSKLPLEYIKSFHSVAEYNVYKQAKLQPETINGKWAYVRNIDWNFYDSVSEKTNVQRVCNGLPPLDPTGMPYQLHHIGQKADSPLAILTAKEHTGNYSILHKFLSAGTGKNVNTYDWKVQRSAFWKSLLYITDGMNDICDLL